MKILYQKKCYFCFKKLARYEGIDYFLPHIPDSDTKFCICDECDNKVKKHGKMDAEIFDQLKTSYLAHRPAAKYKKDN